MKLNLDWLKKNSKDPKTNNSKIPGLPGIYFLI